MGEIFSKIKESLIKIIGGIFIVVMTAIGFYSTCIGKSDPSGWGTNCIECKMLYNEHSRKVAKTCLPNAKPNREEIEGVVYRESYEDKDVALEVFRDIIETIGEYHAGGKVNADYGYRDEMYFVCYGEEQSIIVTYREYKKFTSISIQYADTEKYDWDYLSSRIKN